MQKINLTARDKKIHIYWMILRLITKTHENSLIEEHELIYSLVFSGFLVMKTASLLHHNENYKPTDYRL
jgi:hypothetical protein